MTILTNVTIWDGLEGEVLPVDAIEFTDGVIRRLGKAGSLTGADTRDMAGAFIMPGLIDAHIHLCLNPEISDPEAQDKFTDDELLAQMANRAEKMLAAGITTARDLGGGQWLELEIRDRINSGEISGSRLICSGQPVTSVKGHCHFWGGEAPNVDAVRDVIERQIAHGVDLIKVMATGGNLTPGSRPVDAQFDEDTLRIVVEMASAHGFHVAAHCHGTAGIRNAAAARVTTIEHCSWVGEQGWARDYDPSAVDLIVANGVWVSPTINLGWKRRVGQGGFETLLLENYKKMRAAGVKLIASTDAGIPNVFHHDLGRALPFFAHFAGLSNAEVLRAATSDCAGAIGLGNLTGSIAPGLAADLLVLDGNPLNDLSVLERPIDVVARGRSLNGLAGAH